MDEAVKHYAERHRLKTRVDDDNTTTIPGKYGQIYEYDVAGRSTLAVMFMPRVPMEKPITGWKLKWTYWREKCAAAGMEVIQNGDWEGTLRFDHANAEHARLAIRVAGIKRKRLVSEEMARAGAERLATLRQNRLAPA